MKIIHQINLNYSQMLKLYYIYEFIIIRAVIKLLFPR
jgi:hypothetical protein